MMAGRSDSESSTPVNTPHLKRVPEDDDSFGWLTQSVAKRQRTGTSSSCPSLPENVLALKAAVAHLEQQLANGRSPNEPTPITEAPENNLWAPYRPFHRPTSHRIMDPVRRILSYDEDEEEDDDVIFIESDEEELEDDVFMVEEEEVEKMPVIHIQDGELEAMATDEQQPQEQQQQHEQEQEQQVMEEEVEEESVEWEDIQDRALTDLIENLESVNMTQQPKKEEEEEEDITDEEMLPIGEKFDDMGKTTIPIGPSMMVVRALFSLLHTIVTENCEGCINDYWGQLDHPLCVMMPWELKVELYFNRALERLTTDVLLSFFPSIYPVKQLFESERVAVKNEATRFLAVDMKTSLVKNHIKEMLLTAS